MCISCGNPDLVHDVGPATSSVDEGTGGALTLGGADLLYGQSFAPTPPPAGSAPEIAFLSGVTSATTIASNSFWTWVNNYNGTSDAAKWGSPLPGTAGGTVTYFFNTASNWTGAEQTALASGLALWSAVANIAFAPAASAASANFIFYRQPYEPGGYIGSAFESSNSTSVGVGGAFTGSFNSTGTYIAIDTRVPGFGPIGDSFSKYGGYPYQTLVHEIGHLIGLGHGGPYNGSVNPATQQFSAYDTRLWTLMSYINPWDARAQYYSSYPVTGTNWGISPDGYYNEPTTPMILDILAAQWLYGPATSGPLASGGQVFGFNSNISGLIAPYFNFTVNTNPVITIWDGGLHNTLDLSGWSTRSVINLNPGTFSSVNGAVNNIAIAAGTIIENAIGGGGNDAITGNSYNNTLMGGAGNDAIDGGPGTDTVVFSGLRWQYQTQNMGGVIHIVDGRAGAPNGADDVINVEFFQFADYTVPQANIINHPPVATAPDYGAVRGQVINVSLLFSASDADNNTLTYYFYDNTPDAGSGHFTVNGVVQPANTTFAVTAAQLAQTTFTAGSVSDDLFVNVNDGVDFSGPKEFHVIVPPNHAPVLTAPDYSTPRGQVIAASSLFSASDADNDTLTYYFYDNSSGAMSGHFTVNGVVQAANTTFGLTTAQLAQTTFTAGSAISDDLFVNVNDGFTFSGPKEFHVVVPPNHGPVLTAPDYAASKGQIISASALFSASDADSDTLTYYFYDNTSDAMSGHFTVNGVVQAANTTFGLTAAQLAQTTFTAGSISDDLFANVNDGFAFSGPKEFHVVVPPNHAPVLTAPDYSPTGQVIAASSLFSASDADNDTLTYYFYDNTPAASSGHFTVNGVVQPANTTFGLTAAQLAQTTFTAGTGVSDDLFVNVFDGVAFSGPQEFHILV
jgi:hypothetical protein